MCLSFVFFSSHLVLRALWRVLGVSLEPLDDPLSDFSAKEELQRRQSGGRMQQERRREERKDEDEADVKAVYLIGRDFLDQGEDGVRLVVAARQEELFSLGHRRLVC